MGAESAMRKWILAVAILFLAPAFAAERSADLKVAVQLAAGDLASARPTLRVKLTNLGQEAINVEKARLPWGNRYSITLLAVGEHAKYEQPIPLVFPIDDLLPGDVEIKPGEALEGSIRLDYVFKDIPNTLRKEPLLLLWSYRLEATDGKQSERLTGSVTLPQLPAPSR
ncbi:MAG: hypothetical protein ACRDQZ_02360 [Mycobacteriales bacterium]